MFLIRLNLGGPIGSLACGFRRPLIYSDSILNEFWKVCLVTLACVSLFMSGSCHQMGASNDDLVSNLEYLLLLCFSPRASFEIWRTFKV